MKVKKIRHQILEDAKPVIKNYGWNENLFKKISENSKYTLDDIQVLFSKGYLDLMQLYFDEVNIQMTRESKKINLLRLRIHERIREIIILRLKIMSNNKIIASKTFFHLLLPQNYKISIKNIYKTSDQIWFLAGDTSTDFNFYSKRIILSSVYSATLIHFFNNNNFEETLAILNKQLKKVSNIPKIKNRINDAISLAPQIMKFRKNFSFFKQ